MKASDVLIEARRLIAEVGWTQGAAFLHDREGRLTGVCALVSLKIAGPGLTTAVLANAYGYLTTESGRSLVSWNDAPERTKTDVLDLFDHAIKRALEDEALAAEAVL